jgi:hypothetical protein
VKFPLLEIGGTMTTRFDEKGKYFSTVINKIPIPVVIQTEVNRLEGHYHIRPEIRLKDGINNDVEKFIALTDVIIFTLNGEKLYETDFLIVNRKNIVWLFPKDGP